MELIERYLQAVKFWLPKHEKEDIIAELSADIYAQVEERESAVGRPLVEAEVEEILKRRGHPLRVANNFLPQRHLIGPMLFPVYLFVLKILGLCYLIPWCLSLLGLLSFNGRYLGGFAAVSSGVWSGAFITFGVVTLVFAILEQVDTRSGFLRDWNTRKLPPVRDPNLIPRSGTAIELVVNLIFVAWWASYAHAPSLPVGWMIGSSIRITLDPLWVWFFWGYLLIAIFNTVLAGMNLLHPSWTVRRAIARLVSDAAGSVLFCWLLKSNIVTGSVIANLPAEKARTLTLALNHWMEMLFPISVVLVLVIVAANIYRIVRLTSATSPQRG